VYKCIIETLGLDKDLTLPLVLGLAIRACYSAIKACYSAIKVCYSAIKACSLLTEENKFPPWD
jgi:hypothetical protein